jgi:hypothetical protein
MTTGEHEFQGPEASAVLRLVAGDEEYPSPITVGSGGSCFQIPIPAEVLERLGGPAELGHRLTRLLEAESHIATNINPSDVVELARQYNSFFDNLETITPDPGAIQAAPRRWSATIPIPSVVVERLGGYSQLSERVQSIVESKPHLLTGISSLTAITLTSQYLELLGQLEIIITPPRL